MASPRKKSPLAGDETIEERAARADQDGDEREPGGDDSARRDDGAGVPSDSDRLQKDLDRHRQEMAEDAAPPATRQDQQGPRITPPPPHRENR